MARDPDRIQFVLRTLEHLWTQHPDQRLGQLLENYAFEPLHNVTMNDVWHQEDDVTLANLLAALKEENE